MGTIKTLSFILILAIVLGGCPAKMARRSTARKGYIVDQYENKKEVVPFDESYWCCR